MWFPCNEDNIKIGLKEIYFRGFGLDSSCWELNLVAGFFEDGNEPSDSKYEGVIFWFVENW